MKRALIIEDDPGFVGNIVDVLDSLGHHSEVVECLADARRLIKEQEFDYFLVDLEIPVEPKGRARIQNGEHMIRQIVERYGPLGPPVLVVTGNGKNSPQLAAQTMQLGAVDYITKPLPTSGNTLDKAILSALKRRETFATIARQNMYRQASQQRAKFQGGELVFHDDYVSLCGVKITSDKGYAYGITILEQLAKENEAGQRPHLTADVLAREIDLLAVPTTVRSTIHNLRREIKKRLRKNLNLVCGPHDVIDHDEQGYSLRRWVTTENNRQPVCSDTLPESTPDRPASGRQAWILKQLTKGVRLERQHVERHFRISPKTAKRELKALTGEKIEYVRTASPGFCRHRRKEESGAAALLTRFILCSTPSLPYSRPP